MSEAVAPVTNVSVAQQLVGGALVEPDVGSKATLEVVDPVASVLLVRGDPVHDTVAVTFVVFPVAFIEVARLVGHLALTLLHALGPVSLVD